jgi:hypothetical protein
MNCEFLIDKKEIPDTRILLSSIIESKFGLSLDLNKDIIYLFDNTGNKIQLTSNKLEDLKDNLPKTGVKVNILKTELNEGRIDKNKIENILKQSENPDKKFAYEESCFIKPEQKKVEELKPKKSPVIFIATTQINFSLMCNNVIPFEKVEPDLTMEINTINKICSYVVNNIYTQNDEFDTLIRKKPYGVAYFQILNVIKQMKDYIADVGPKFIKLQEYANFLDKKLKDNQIK